MGNILTIRSLPSPVWMPLTDLVANGIVLERKERMQHLNAEPPVVTEAGLWRAIFVSRYESSFFSNFVQEKLAVLVVPS